MATVIYDADCGFCKWCLALLLSVDRSRVHRSRSEHGRPSPPIQQVWWGRSAVPGALRPLALETEEADLLLAELTPKERAASWHLIIDGDERPDNIWAPIGAQMHPAPAAAPPRLSAGAAIPPALDLIPYGRFPAAIFRRFPAATERAYWWVADHRSLLGRFVPTRARRWADRVIAARDVAARPQ